MKGLIITTYKKIRIEDFKEPAYKSIGKAVGGYIEIVHPARLKKPYCMVVNEEGLLHRFPVNVIGCVLYGTANHGCPIVGDIVILKEGFVNGERDFVGMTDEELAVMGNEIINISRHDYSWDKEEQHA